MKTTASPSPSVPFSPAPRLRYARVREALLDDLSHLSIGDRLPPERELSEHYQVDRTTVRRALDDLSQEGFVIRHQGRGTFVRRKSNAEANAAQVSTVAFSVPGIDIPIHRRYIAAVEKEVSRRGGSLFICNAQLDTTQEHRNLERLAKQDISSVIITPFGDDSMKDNYVRLVQSLLDAGKRVVMIDQYVPGLDVPVVMSDRQRIGYLATEHLIMLGHRNIAYATSGRYDTAGTACLAGYRQALDDYGIEFRPGLVIERPLAFSARPVKEAVTEILKANPRAFTAIATEHFSMSYGIVKALEELGLKADRDIGVVGAELYQNESLLYLTHTTQNFDEMGRQAVRLLFDPADANSMQKHIMLPPRLIIGRPQETLSSGLEDPRIETDPALYHKERKGHKK